MASKLWSVTSGDGEHMHPSFDAVSEGHETRRDGRALVAVERLQVDVVAGADAGRQIVTNEDRVGVGTAPACDLVLSDPQVSRFHLELRRAPGGIEVIDHRSTNGTFAGAVRIQTAVVAPGTILSIGSSQIRVIDAGAETIDVPTNEAFYALRGRSIVMRRLMQRIEKVAATESSVLVSGESGSGKEGVARAIHDASPRAAE